MSIDYVRLRQPCRVVALDSSMANLLAFCGVRRFSLVIIISVVLVCEIVLFISEYFQWFDFNRRKGVTVLCALSVAISVIALWMAWLVILWLCKLRSRFGVINLFQIILTLAIPFAWLSTELQSAHRQREFATEIDRCGGYVILDGPTESRWCGVDFGRDFFCDVTTLCVTTPDGLVRVQDFAELHTLYVMSPEVADKDLANVHHLVKLEILYLRDTGMTDASLRTIGTMKRLRALSIGGTKITDQGLQNIDGLRALESLSIDRTAITDAGLLHIKNLDQLRGLRLDETPIGDRGVMELQPLHRLEVLWLPGTQVSDNGVLYLKDLSCLKMLVLNGTQVTDGGAHKLKDCLPQCEVVWAAN